MHLKAPERAAMAILAMAATGCGSSCPQGRVETADGTCVRQDVVDFAACVRAAGGSEISREDAHSITATAFGASGTVGWQNSVRDRFNGPAVEHQRMVIETCITRTADAGPSPDLSYFAGRWSSVQDDGSVKRMTINPDGSFLMDRGAPQCRVTGIISVAAWNLTRHITWSDCAGAPVGTTQRFRFEVLGREAFALAPDGTGQPETFRRGQ